MTTLNQQDHPSDRPSNQISQIKRWFEAAIPEPNDRNVHTQIGVHLEEVSEMLEVLRDAGGSSFSKEQLSFAVDVMLYIQKQLKSGGILIDLDRLDQVAYLDSQCDQIVTAVGNAHMQGFDIEGGLAEVADSNDSKFGADGDPIFNEHRKIIKGPNYRAPDLSSFVSHPAIKD